MSGISIGDFLKERIASFSVKPLVYQIGSVLKAGDGVVRVRGLRGSLYGELLEFNGGIYGMALDLEENGVGAVLLDSADKVKAGDSVRGTGAVVQTPVGEKLLGRVLDPIGRALDGKAFEPDNFLPAERPAPTIVDRRPVRKPMLTGILAIDSMIPIGRGQRELIIGDRQTGKTSIAVDSIINQKNSDILCVYCAIGQKASTTARVIETLRAAGAMSYSVVVAATAAASPAMQYLAPYCACCVAEGFMNKGRDVLIVYDDLSKHAVAYRTMSLLLHRPPGREAFPGDVFYLHSRLLERSACLSEKNGGGSITALPIIETMEGNISAFIPTNLISITDGQIFLEADLFRSGVRPAVNTGLSVSRVGRNAQPQAMKAVSSSLRISLSQYREMAIFSRFGSDIDASTQKLLDKGESLVNVFKQNKSKPYSLFEETALLLAYSADYFVGVHEKVFPQKISELLSFLHKKCVSEEQEINLTGALSDKTKEAILSALRFFKDGGAL